MSGGSSVLWCFPVSIPLQGDNGSSARCVSMSGRYGGNMAMWLGGVSLGGYVVFPVG